ncbi:MAG: mechanosensitive ion channel family protein [Candidatus Heimdallarchaeota archaeon]|nr:mechanosensitive ion channel family protein [Candidatus Heimdallarchaeota archaeon]
MVELSMEVFTIVLLLIVGIIVGTFIDRVIIKKLRRTAARRKLNKSRLLLNSLKGTSVFWTVFIFTYLIINFTLEDNATKIQVMLIFETILILALAYFLQKLFLIFINYYIRRDILPSTSIFNNIAKIMVLLLAIVALLKLFDISVTPLLAAFGVGGLAIAFALQDTLANLFAGIYIIASKQLNPKDYVQLQSGVEGYIQDIGWRNTSIRSLQNNLTIIPNSLLSSLIVINYSLPIKEMSIKIPIGVSYDSDLEKVERVTIEEALKAVTELEGAVPDFTPRVRFNQFADFSINFNLVIRIKDFENQFYIQHELIKRLHRRYSKEGIVIPFPIRTIHIEDKEKR